MNIPELLRTYNLGDIGNDLCLEYSDNPERLQEILDNIDISIRINYPIKKGDYFRLPIDVTIKRGTETIHYMFYESHFNSLAFIESDRVAYSKRKKVVNDLKYSILCDVGSHLSCFDSFEDFCNLFDYDEDSRKAYKLWQDTARHRALLLEVFEKSDAECMPR